MSLHVTPDFKLGKRFVANREEWGELVEQKRGPCRACGETSFIEFHHLIHRSGGGNDVPDNIIPLDRGCHRVITDALPGYRAVLAAIRHNLTDEEREYLIATRGDAWLNKNYPNTLNCKPKRRRATENVARPKARYQITVPVDERENGWQILDDLLQQCRDEVREELGLSEDAPYYFVLVPVLNDWLQSRPPEGIREDIAR